MNVVTRLRAAATRAGSALRRFVRAEAGGIPYHGATTGRRARGWKSPSVGPNAGVLGALTTLRDRSRQAVRNDGYAGAAIDRLVSNMVGTGIKPLSRASDAGFRAALHALWTEWTDESDADGRLDFYGQQALAVRGWLESGEVFGRLRPRFPEDMASVPMQVQLVEPELVPVNYNAQNGRNSVRAGIEFTPIGARAAYWMHRTRLGDAQDMDTQALVRVPAESVIHLYDPVRPGQIRGVPHLTRALIRLHELDKYDDATLLKQELSNLFVGFLTSDVAAMSEDLNPLTGAVAETENGRGLLGLEPGLFQELAPGQKVEFSDPPQVGSTYADFMRQQMLGVAAAVDVPYEVLTGDLSKVNDRTARIILNEFRRRITQRVHTIIVFQFCRTVWHAWLDRAVLDGRLVVPGGIVAYVADPRPFRRVRWVPQGWAYIHPVQDVDAGRAAVRAGFRSRSDVVSELGDDVEDVDAQIAEDNARADALGLTLDSDPRRTDGSGKPAVALDDDVDEPPTSGNSNGNGTAARTRSSAPPITVNVHAPTTIERGAISVEPAPVPMNSSEVVWEDGRPAGVVETYADGRRIEKRVVRKGDGSIAGVVVAKPGMRESEGA